MNKKDLFYLTVMLIYFIAIVSIRLTFPDKTEPGLFVHLLPYWFLIAMSALITWHLLYESVDEP